MSQLIDVIYDSKVTILPKLTIRRLVELILKNEQIEHYHLNIIFVNTTYIQQLNKTYLNEDYVTDVIAFALGESEAVLLEGEIYICTEVAKQQAKQYRASYGQELLRLVVHGVLHLVGYDDLTVEEQRKMRKVEDEYLSQYSPIQK